MDQTSPGADAAPVGRLHSHATRTPTVTMTREDDAVTREAAAGRDGRFHEGSA